MAVSGQQSPVFQQRGVALISVLLVFALAAIIASEVITRSYRDIRRTSNFVNSGQAYHYALAGEQFARQMLYRDYEDGGTVLADTLVDDWAIELNQFDIEHGIMAIKVVDLQGRFNINNLLTSGGGIDNTVSQQFRQLLSAIDVDADVLPVLLDWLDSDHLQLANGAEDENYQREGYLAGNAALFDRTELRLLERIDYESYDKLKDYVVALPKLVAGVLKQATKYNINTLDAKLLESLLSVNQSDSLAIVARQKRGGHHTPSAWINEFPTLSVSAGLWGVSSEYFEVIVKVNFDGRISMLRSQLYRDQSNGKLTVLKRQQGRE